MTLTIETHRESQEHANEPWAERRSIRDLARQCKAGCIVCQAKGALAEAITYFLASACNESRP